MLLIAQGLSLMVCRWINRLTIFYPFFFKEVKRLQEQTADEKFNHRLFYGVSRFFLKVLYCCSILYKRRHNGNEPIAIDLYFVFC